MVTLFHVSSEELYEMGAVEALSSFSWGGKIESKKIFFFNFKERTDFSKGAETLC